MKMKKVEIKMAVATAYQEFTKWVDRDESGDTELLLSCVDRFGDDFPRFSISRTDSNLKSDKDHDGWEPTSRDFKEYISLLICSHGEPYAKFHVSKEIKISENAVDEIVEYMYPFVLATEKNLNTMKSVQENMERCGFGADY